MPDVPLWQQILTDLEQRIAAGDIADRFPTDRELVEAYGVSRHTVREAVERLRARGVIERHRGRGSFVRAAEFRQPVGTLYSLFREVESAGVEQRSDVRDLRVVTDTEVAARLGVDAATPLVRLERRRLADGVPLALDTAWLLADIARPLLEADFTHTAIYDELDRRCGVRLDGGSEVIRPVLPTAHLRQELDLEADEALLRVERIGTVRDRPVEWRVSLIRGSRFALVSEWDPTRPAGEEVLHMTAQSFGR